MDNQANDDTKKAWIQLHRAHLLLVEKVEDSLKSHKLPPLSWYDVLIELYQEKSAGLRQFEIGERVLLKKHNLSRLIDRLVQKKLVVRKTCSEDGRGNIIKISREGEAALKQMWPVYSESMQTYFGTQLSTVQLQELSGMLGKLIDQFTKK